MQYEITILEPSHISLNTDDDKIYTKCGGNVVGALAFKTEDVSTKLTKKNYDEFLDSHYNELLDAAVCFSSELIKQLFDTIKGGNEYSTEYKYLDRNSNLDLLNKLTGKRLLVEEVMVLDYREDDDETKYENSEELLASDNYEPDDWEVVLKVIEIV